MRVKDLALEPFVPEAVEASEWKSDEPYEDPEGFPVLPGKLNEPDAVEWKRPAELGLGDVPMWSKFAQAAGEEGATDPVAEHDPIIAKPPKRSTVGQMLELHCKAMSNPLTADHAFIYHMVGAPRMCSPAAGPSPSFD